MVASEAGHEVVTRMLIRSGSEKNYQTPQGGKATHLQRSLIEPYHFNQLIIVNHTLNLL